jgi:ornithine cyclodeaminase/alanine dehydrogenase
MHTSQLLYLSQADVESVGLTMAEVIEALEAAFREKGEGRVEMPPKPGIHPGGGDNFIHARIYHTSPACSSSTIQRPACPSR